MRKYIALCGLVMALSSCQLNKKDVALENSWGYVAPHVVEQPGYEMYGVQAGVRLGYFRPFVGAGVEYIGVPNNYFGEHSEYVFAGIGFRLSKVDLGAKPRTRTWSVEPKE
ncbi:MAG: hypothetical protein ACMXYC_02590 [Candidatus Woesearchaeota archaeon]